jgi:hypothetical protein
MERKGFCYNILVIIGVLLSGNNFAQQNLVPNNSFESFEFCPYSAGQISAVDDWFSVKGSVDYFNTCGTNEYGFWQVSD